MDIPEEMSRIRILMYHMVTGSYSAEEHRFAVPPQIFGSHMRALRSKNYVPVALSEVQDHLLGNRKLPGNAVAVTLDDGYADNYANAFPTLQQYEIPATIFLVINEIGGENRWERGRSSSVHPLLNWRQIREMHAAGIGFGSHTLSHPRLSKLSDHKARTEIQNAKKLLEDHLGTSAEHFAYPYGDLSEQTVDLVREAGHTLACSTRCGFNRSDVDPLLLRRIDVYGTDSTWKLLQKLRFGTNDAGLLQTARYYLRQTSARLFDK